MSNPFQQGGAAAAANPSNPFAGGNTALATAPQNTALAAGGFAAPAAQSQIPNKNIEEVDFDSDIQVGGLERFPKLAKDQRARVAFILFNEKGNPRIKMSESFNFGKFGDPNAVGFIAPKHNKDLMKQLVAFGGGKEPTAKFGTVVLHYDTNMYGAIDPQGKFKLEAFIFGAEKWNILKRRHQEWGLNAHDILITCTEPNYQKHDYEVARESLWSGAPEDMRKDILERAEGLFNGALNRLMGFSRTDQEIVGWMQTGRFPDRASGPAPQGGAAGPAGGPSVNPFAGGGQQAVTNQTIAQQAGVGDAQSADFASLVVSGTNEAQQQPDPAAPAAETPSPFQGGEPAPAA